MNRQEMIEQQVAAIAAYDENIIKDPNLKADLFTINAYQTIISVCKEVVEKKGQLAFESIVQRLSEYGFDGLYVDLMEGSFQKARYDQLLYELQISHSVRKSKGLLEEVEKEEITFEEFQSKVSKIGNEYNLGTSSKWSADKIVCELQKTEEKLIFARSGFYREVVQPSKRTVNVIGARTGVGKSALALNLVNDLAERYLVLYFNLEMTEKEIYQRLMSIQTGIPINRFRMLSLKEKNLLSDAAYRFENKLNFKLFNGSKSVEGIQRIVSREARKEHCIVFIDHIGYVSNRKISNTRERVQNTMIELNSMTKDYDCTVFALSQLNRDTDDAPKLINLKDSGEVEQTAHSIVLLHDLSKDYSALSEYELICAKNRGQTGRRKVDFNKSNQTFYEHERR